MPIVFINHQNLLNVKKNLHAILKRTTKGRKTTSSLYCIYPYFIKTTLKIEDKKPCKCTICKEKSLSKNF